MTTWIRLSDRMGEHPKTLQVPRAHRWALIEVLGYCSRNLTDGFIPSEMMPRLIDSDELASLMFAGFIKKCTGGYVFHDYLDWQESRQSVEERSAKRSQAGRRGAAKRWQSDGKSHGTSHSDGKGHSTSHSTGHSTSHNDGKGHGNGYGNGYGSSHVNGKRHGKWIADTDTDTEIKTTSIVRDSTNPDSSLTATAASMFDEFWKIYPRRVGKQAALKAFTKEAKTTDPADIIAGAQRLADDPNLPDKAFIPHPATWLTRAGWLDEPYPQRETKPADKPTPQPPTFDRAAAINPEAVPPPTNLHDILKGNTA